MILGTNIPVYFGDDWVFLGPKVFLEKGVAVPIVCVMLLLLCLSFVLWLYRWNKGTRLGPVTNTTFENVNSDAMSFVASYFFPLVSFSIGTTWRHIAVLGLLFVLIGVIYIKADVYYCNPTLLLAGFRVYKVQGSIGEDKEIEQTIIVWGKMKDNDRFEYIPIDDNICFAYKI